MYPHQVLALPTQNTAGQKNAFRPLLSESNQTEVNYKNLKKFFPFLKMADFAVEEVTFKWDLSPEEIANLTTDVIEKCRGVYDKVGSSKAEEVTIENTLQVNIFNQTLFTLATIE